MTPKYIGTMLELSRKNLNLETIDIYYIHNPETQLEAIERKEFLARIRTIFEFLETAVANGKIGVYGTATWNGFRAQPTERGWLSLDELMRVAREVAGDAHHFRAIQLPYNLAMPEAVTRSNQFVHAGKATTLAAAKAFGLAVCASASLLQGQLSRGLPPIVANAFGGFATDAQRSIQFVRSTPGVDVALVGMKSVDHVRDTLETARKPPATVEELMGSSSRARNPKLNLSETRRGFHTSLGRAKPCTYKSFNNAASTIQSDRAGTAKRNQRACSYLLARVEPTPSRGWSKSAVVDGRDRRGPNCLPTFGLAHSYWQGSQAR